MSKYQIIYADPPWEYSDKRINHGGMEYPTMKTKDIQELPIKEIADNNCILFIWATFPNIKEVFKVIDSWGFYYKTLGFSWIKTNKRQQLNQASFFPGEDIDDFFGIGFYTKSNCEVCLIGLKGEANKLIIDNSVSSTIISPRGIHSKKPDEVRDRIIKLCGNRPRIELFARQKIEGWDSWGNEIENDIIIKNS